MSRSIDTDGSPASIFAIRDWLDLSALARDIWVSRRRCLRSFRLWARRSLRSTYAASSSDNPRKSFAVPIFQPLASSRRFFTSRMCVLLQPSLAGRNHGCGRGPRLLREHVQDHDRIRGYVVHDSPRRGAVLDSQFVATRSDRGHGSRLGHGQGSTLLQAAQEVAHLQPCGMREGRALDLSVQPGERLVGRAHRGLQYVISDMKSSDQPAQQANITSADRRRRGGRCELPALGVGAAVG